MFAGFDGSGRVQSEVILGFLHEFFDCLGLAFSKVFDVAVFWEDEEDGLTVKITGFSVFVAVVGFLGFGVTDVVEGEGVVEVVVLSTLVGPIHLDFI